MATVVVMNAPTGFADSDAARRLQARHALVDAAPADGPFGVLAFGDAARQALALQDERLDALVLVAPTGLALDAREPGDASVSKAVLIGTLDRRFGKDAVSRHRKGLPRCQVVLVYAAGEDIAADRPEAFAAAAGDFLERRERFAFATGSMAISR